MYASLLSKEKKLHYCNSFTYGNDVGSFYFCNKIVCLITFIILSVTGAMVHLKNLQTEQ